jgi:protein ImuB
MRRIVSLSLPSFATDRLTRLPMLAAWRAKPFATTAKAGGRLVIVAANAPAEAAGIAPGQVLADARALEPGLRVTAADPCAEGSALAALADGLTRYTPWVAVDEQGGGGARGALLDITGCAHLFGGEAALLADLVGRLERCGFAARAAVAASAGAAWAIARFAPHDRLIIAPGTEGQALAALPVAALRLPAETTGRLERLGLRRIGALYTLPRAPLARRFGSLVGRRLDQALGRVQEPISPRRPVEPWRLQLAFAEPIARCQDIAAATEHLTAALCRRLAEEMKGVRRLVLALYRVDGTLARAEIGTSRPVRETKHLMRLFAEKLDGLDAGLGLDLVALSAPVVEPLAASQSGLLACASEAALPALAALVDRLANRLGASEVRRLVPVASHLPERAQRAAQALAAAGETEAPWRKRRPRPLRLFTRPQPVDAIAPVPDDPPLLFRWREQLHRIRRADGPERIAGEWWQGSVPAQAEVRDYYRVEDEAGRRFWLYREGLYHPERRPRWFLHGLFA